MASGSNAAVTAKPGLAPEASAEDMADALIAAHDGNSRAAVVALIGIVQGLKDENGALRGAASPGFVRRRPLVFGASS